MTLKEALLNSSLVPSSVINEASMLSNQSRKNLMAVLKDVIASKEIEVDPIKLDEVFSNLYSLKLITNYTQLEFNHELAEKVKYSELDKYQALTVRYEGSDHIAFKSDSTDYSEMMNFCRNRVGKITPIIVTAHVYNPIYNREVKSRLLQLALGQDSRNVRRSDIKVQDIADSKEDVQIFLTGVIRTAYAMRASDIHIKPLNDIKCLIFFFIDGVDTFYGEYEVPNETLAAVLRLSCEMPDQDITADQTGKMFTKFNDQLDLELRVNLMRSRTGMDINIRFLANKAIDINSIGLSGYVKAQYERVLKLTKGLILLTGPVGSGKSSTMYAGVLEIQKSNRSIFTVEDPIEISIEEISQFQVDSVNTPGKSKEAVWLSKIQGLLRHNARAIMIGEIRSLDTAKATFEAATTAALVISSLHTNDAKSAIFRLINMGVSREQISECLAAVISQRLVRRVCTDCCVTYSLPEEHPWRDKFKLGTDKLELSKGVGCPKCSYTGYYGRVPINEVLIFDKELRRLIANNADIISIDDAAKRNNFEELWVDGKNKALQGITTLDEIEPFVDDII